VPSTYPPLNLAVRTPRLTLAAATDDLLERLVPVVRAGVVTDGEPPLRRPAAAVGIPRRTGADKPSTAVSSPHRHTQAETLAV
jgi:hypothetical protein